MKREQIYTENTFDFIIRERNNYVKFFIDYYAVVIVILSLLGGLNQIINFLFLSPSLIVFYSPKQGLLDGVLFLFFIILSTAFFLIYFFIIHYISQKLNIHTRIILYVLMFLLCGYMIIMFTFEYMILLGLFIILPTLIINLLLLYPLTKNDEIIERKSDFEKRITERNLKRKKFFFPIFYIFISISAYYILVSKLNNISIKTIYNYEFITEKLNISKDFKLDVIYSNGDYIFLKDDKSNKILVLGIDILTKDLIKNQ